MYVDICRTFVSVIAVRLWYIYSVYIRDVVPFVHLLFQKKKNIQKKWFRDQISPFLRSSPYFLTVEILINLNVFKLLFSVVDIELFYRS